MTIICKFVQRSERRVLKFVAGVLLFAGMQSGYAATWLSNEDFKYGTYIIDKPGVYKLSEDISFNPNSPTTLTAAINDGLIPANVVQQLGLPNPVDAYHAGFPLFTQFLPGGTDDFAPGGPLDAQYDPAGFGLGFFAAIVIKTDNVVLDLNGYTLEQSEEHALLQRFFALIELAEQPFIPKQGPADFGDEIESANNVVIRNGVLGRSSHHGIHGNGNNNVRIKNVDFVDYEVAAVALNGVKGLHIRNSNATNRKDVPILGTFSSAQFIKTYINELARNQSTTVLNVNGDTLDITEIKTALMAAINNTHEDLIVDRNLVDGRPQIDKSQHPDEYALFANSFGLIDGNSYSFLVNNLGVAVNGFPTQPDGVTRFASENIWLSNVRVLDQQAFINEIITLKQDGKAVIDPVGAVFQFRNLHPDTGVPVTMSSLDESTAQYTGNPVANAQAFVAKAQLNGEFDNSQLDLTRNAINQAVLDWVEGKPGYTTLDSLVQSPDDYICNGDSMFHVNKGVIAFKMDAAKNVVLHKTIAKDIVNKGSVGSDLCGDYSGGKSHPLATLPGYGGAKTRAYTFAGSKNIFMLKNYASGITADAGSAIGVDMMTDSKGLTVFKAAIEDVEAGLNSASGYFGPNELPDAVGFHIGEDTSRVAIIKACAEMLSAFNEEFVVDDDSGTAYLRRVCR